MQPSHFPALLRAAALAVCACAASAMAASFDCARARAGLEKMVCADAELSDLDDMLGRYYQGAMAALQENGACLRDDQQQWLRGPRAQCRGRACVKDAYLARLGELFALQPGINTQRRLALPDVPTLIWAMAPQPQEPPSVPSRPASVEGELRYDENVGAYVIRDSAGKQYALLLDIMRGGANEAQLSSLSKTLSGGYKVAARGRLADRGPGVPFFDHRYCTYIYRLPN